MNTQERNGKELFQQKRVSFSTRWAIPDGAVYENGVPICHMPMVLYGCTHFPPDGHWKDPPRPLVPMWRPLARRPLVAWHGRRRGLALNTKYLEAETSRDVILFCKFCIFCEVIL